MKTKFFLLAVIFSGGIFIPRVSAQADEIAQLALNIEKLAQFKQILTDLKKGYQILNGGYNTIKSISEGNFNLHKTFLDGLSQVSPTVRNYRRVADIANCQIKLVQQYQKSFQRFSADENFTASEIAYLGRVYDNLFGESLRNLDELLTVITSGVVRMSDDERLQAIDRIYADMQDKLLFLRQFNNNTNILSLQREKEKKSVERLRTIYGTKQ